MDANGTRFHLLLGRDDWAQCSVGGTKLRELWETHSPPRKESSALAFNDERAVLSLGTRLFKFIAAPKDTRPDLSNRRGAGRDRYGNWYWIDETGLKIRVRSSGSRQVSDFWSPAIGSRCAKQTRLGDFQPVEPAPQPASLPLSGLAVTEDHYLVIGVLQPAGLLIFDLHTGGEPTQLLWPNEVDFKPFDMAARPGGGVWILDRERDCYWGLDRHFNLIDSGLPDLDVGPEPATDFKPLAVSGGPPPTERRTFPRSIPLDLASPLQAIDPIAIEALPDGTVLILDRDPDPKQRFSKVYRYDLSQRIGEISTEAVQPLSDTEQESEFRLVGYDIAFLPKHVADGIAVPDRLYVAADDGNQTYVFNLSQLAQRVGLEWQPVPEFLPMRLFGGKGLVTAGTEVYYDFSESWIPVVAQRRPRYEDQATLATPPNAFDGVEPDCVWHRLLLDACIPPETKVEIWSRAANELFDLELTPWSREPTLQLRGDGSELPFLPRKRTLDEREHGDGTWELLFQRARGRFLQLQLSLSGNERTTPHLRALRAYFPRFSYLKHYLPSVYREDEQSASFLERFLANLEGIYTSLEDKIAAVQVLFDTRSAPPETLAWLAQWFGIVFDPSWDEPTQRMLIRHAMEFFQYRGTIHGLKTALHLALDPCADENIFNLPSRSTRDGIRIVEQYLTRRTPGIVFGDTSEQAGPRRVSLTSRWVPAQGGTNLSTRYTDFINSRSSTPQAATAFPLNAPGDPTEQARWAEFARATLGFVPSFGPAGELGQWQTFLRGRDGQDVEKFSLPRDWPTSDQARKDWQDFLTSSQTSSANIVRVLWQEFLARRYHRIRALNQGYGTNWPSFESVALFDTLPPDGAPLADWYQFESVVLQMQRTAHRFTVLLPVPLALVFSPEEHLRRLDLCRRIIDLEKPAHTVFDVRFYWAMFRLGEARLGLDTIMDQGSRAPQLLPKLILGEGFVGQSYLGAPVPEEASDRYILGRDPLGDPRKERRR